MAKYKITYAASEDEPPELVEADRYDLADGWFLFLNVDTTGAVPRQEQVLRVRERDVERIELA